jgi:hypothetical protein
MTNPDLVFDPATGRRDSFAKKHALSWPAKGSSIAPPKFTEIFGQQ